MYVLKQRKGMSMVTTRDVAKYNIGSDGILATPTPTFHRDQWQMQMAAECMHIFMWWW